MQDLTALFESIARREFGLDDLQIRKSDRLDHVEVNKESIRKALQVAYAHGAASVTRGVLTPEQTLALADWQEQHGSKWKTALRAAWMHASAPSALHALRNTHGPKWLDQIPD